MKIPSMLKSVITKQLITVALEGYKQGRKDCLDGDYDEKNYKKQIKNLIKEKGEW